MKTIGLIGGISWESSAHYYQIINQAVQQRLGGVHSAECLLYSVDFAQIEALQRAGDWEALANIMADAGRMEGTFYTGRLKELHGITAIVPNEADRQVVHDIIFKELVIGKINPSSKARLLEIIQELSRMGAEGVILGCTELPMLVGQADCEMPIYDTTYLHAMAGVDYSLNKDGYSKL